MHIDLNALLTQIGKDKGIDKTILIEAVESAVLSAARKQYGHSLNLETQFDEETNFIEVLQFKTVVDQVEDDSTQIAVDDARKEYDSEAMVGDEFGKKLDTSRLGRIAAQTAKQVIIQKMRDAERSAIYDEYKGSKGELINGIVQRYDRGNVIVNLGRTEAALPRREQISRERYRQGDRIRGMILDIDSSARGPQIILTRSHPDFLTKLFEVEVPEIREGVVDIKAVAREPGIRAKVAVHSGDGSVDPVGACVGINGSRVRAVVEELRGEKIDIITWTPDEPSFVAKALSPAEVVRVIVDEDEHSMEVTVPDDQLSLAIGRRGQNVKLASKLSGWRIDVRSVSVVEEESKKARESIEAIPGIEFTHAELLFQEGYRSAKEVAEAHLEDLNEIATISEEDAKALLEKAKAYVESMSDDDSDSDESEEVITDLDKLDLDEVLKASLLKGGINSIQLLVEAEADDLKSIPGIGEDDVATVREAADVFLKPNYQRR